jgi:hypothetical protein
MIGVVDFNQLLNKVANRIQSKQNSGDQQDSKEEIEFEDVKNIFKDKEYEQSEKNKEIIEKLQERLSYEQLYLLFDKVESQGQ